MSERTKAQDYPKETIHRAARRKISQGAVSTRLDLDDEFTDEDISPNTDPKLGEGIWVPVYLFLSLSEIQDAEDTNP